MGEFAGVIRFDGGPVDASLCDRLTRGLPGQARATLWRGGGAAIAERNALKASYPSLPQIADLSSGAVLVADVRLDDHADIIRTLGLDPARRPDDMAILSAACEAWGDDAAARLYGDFAFVLWDERSRRLTLARDAIGIRSLYYFADDHSVTFATTLRRMLAMPYVPRDLDDIALANYMTQTAGDVERSFYRHIRRVPPGGVVIADKGSLRVARYWTPGTITPVKFARDDDYVDAARDLFDRAVASRLPPTGGVASTLSGGLDSTGVAGTAARLLGERRIAGYTRVAGAAHPYTDALDEAANARLLVDRYNNIDWTVIDADSDLPRDRSPEMEAPILGMPRSGGFNPGWFRPLYDAVEQSGARVLLNGGLGNMTLSWVGVPPYAEYLRRGRPVAAGRIALDTARTQGRTLYDVLRKDMMPLVEPLALRRWRWKRHDGGASALVRHNVVSESFLGALDYHRHARTLGTELPFELTGDVRAWRMKFIHNQNPRDNLSSSRHFFSFDQRDPMSDRRLAEFTLGIPEDQFFQKGEGRWLARRVLADRVPMPILTERRFGRQCPEWFHVQNKRRDAMAESIDRIERSPLASRVIDVARLRQLLDTFPDDATAAMNSSAAHGPMLQRGILMGTFLRWHEGGND